MLAAVLQPNRTDTSRAGEAACAQARGCYCEQGRPGKGRGGVCAQHGTLGQAETCVSGAVVRCGCGGCGLCVVCAVCTGTRCRKIWTATAARCWRIWGWRRMRLPSVCMRTWLNCYQQRTSGPVLGNLARHSKCDIRVQLLVTYSRVVVRYVRHTDLQQNPSTLATPKHSRTTHAAQYLQ